MAADANATSSASVPGAAAEVDDEAPMLSDAEAKEIVRRWGVDPTDLRATDGAHFTVWHRAAEYGRTDIHDQRP